MVGFIVIEFYLYIISKISSLIIQSCLYLGLESLNLTRISISHFKKNFQNL